MQLNDIQYKTRTHRKRPKRKIYRNKALEELMCGNTELADGAEEW